MKNTTVEKITTAFKNDQFAVQNLRNDQNFLSRVSGDTAIQVFDDGRVQYTDPRRIVSTGIMAVHIPKSMTINGKERHKKAFYLEGSYYGMGYLIGLMAAKEVELMAHKFVDDIVPDFFIKKSDSDLEQFIDDSIIAGLIGEILKKTSHPFRIYIPDQYRDEIDGLHDGLLKINPDCESLGRRLIALNIGIDVLLSHIYTGHLFDLKNILADQLKLPIMCNAFSVKGDSVKDNKHFFGRDFMFSTANVFQDVACMIIYNPDDPKYPGALPMVSQTAPGFIGSVTAMNLNGIAAGTNMNPTKMCSYRMPGFNSLGLVRDSIQYSGTMDALINRIKNTQRGVSWFYPAADGQSGRACFIEAGKTTEPGDEFPYFKYIDEAYQDRLIANGLTTQFIKEHQGNAQVEAGMVVRESNYVYPDDYLKQFNDILFKTYNDLSDDEDHHKHNTVPPYDPKKFEERGYINATTMNAKSDNYPGSDEANCPAAYYFAPQRENNPDLILVTNGNISPEMRLTAMNDWIDKLAGEDVNDIQWRYDELNDELLAAIDEASKDHNNLIDDRKARQLIDFRAPGSNDYIVKFPKDNWQVIQIHGSISLCELKSKVITSHYGHYGYYGDPWVTITLPNYFIPV
jgi:hypothetical protein